MANYNSDTKVTSNKIVYLNFLMALAIVVFHSNNAQRFRMVEGADYSYFHGLTETIGTLSLGYFFMLSAFLLYKGADSDSVKRKIRSRRGTLLFPFIIWNVIAFFNQILWHRTLPAFTVKGIVEGFSFFPFDGPLWYMFCLILLLIPFYFFSKIKNKLGGVFLIAITLIARYLSDKYLVLNGDYSYVTWLKRFLFYMPMYSIGAFLGKFYGDKVMNGIPNNRYLSICSLILFISAMILLKYCDYYTQAVLSILLPILMWTGVGHNLFAKEPTTFFRLSFWIYATHLLFGHLTLGLLQRFCANIEFYPIGVFAMKIVNALVFSGLSYLLVCFLKRILPVKIMKLITGGRI